MADYLRETDLRYCTAKLRVPAVIKPQMHTVVAAPVLTGLGEIMESHDTICRKSQVTSRLGSGHMRLGTWNPQSQKHIESLPPDIVPDSSLIKKLKPVKPESFYLCKSSP